VLPLLASQPIVRPWERVADLAGGRVHLAVGPGSAALVDPLSGVVLEECTDLDGTGSVLDIAVSESRQRALTVHTTTHNQVTMRALQLSKVPLMAEVYAGSGMAPGSAAATPRTPSKRMAVRTATTENMADQAALASPRRRVNGPARNIMSPRVRTTPRTGALASPGPSGLSGRRATRAATTATTSARSSSLASSTSSSLAPLQAPLALVEAEVDVQTSILQSAASMWEEGEVCAAIELVAKSGNDGALITLGRSMLKSSRRALTLDTAGTLGSALATALERVRLSADTIDLMQALLRLAIALIRTLGPVVVSTRLAITNSPTQGSRARETKAILDSFTRAAAKLSMVASATLSLCRAEPILSTSIPKLCTELKVKAGAVV